MNVLKISVSHLNLSQSVMSDELLVRFTWRQRRLEGGEMITTGTVIIFFLIDFHITGLIYFLIGLTFLPKIPVEMCNWKYFHIFLSKFSLHDWIMSTQQNLGKLKGSLESRAREIFVTMKKPAGRLKIEQESGPHF